ncbi:hypothetical protein [Pseudomonas phage TL]|uniref:Uncharacterized protein n=3 Tax=Viruses TaxID=10239 RepID=W0XAD6_9CAUD|nr:hypothetical protein [Pasteurella multocida]YP_009007818.1 hypothetical protein CF76_gp26 [Pseudomonas phage TL]YP_009639020.1 hypothetical protein FGG60_gp34 [Pseudomonas phage PaP4]AYD79734.1 hypothetical protein CKDKEFKM_00042 [Pseudomonas phage phiPA01_EW]QDH46194.1 hypothetical protein Pa223_033 [Pseudomonas virus Pa223]UVN13772.1 hypothetical protein FBPa29_0020 [Pseudomonas phage vB_PaeP_FBPa29]UZV42285.1 hypothetical protein Ka1_38 [Pseudomonas phage Ka1]AGC35265.1 hypothetical pr
MKKYRVNVGFQDTKVFNADFYRIELDIIRFFAGDSDANPMTVRANEIGAVRGWVSVEEINDGE